MVWIQLVLALKRNNVIILIHQNEVYPIVHETLWAITKRKALTIVKEAYQVRHGGPLVSYVVWNRFLPHFLSTASCGGLGNSSKISWCLDFFTVFSANFFDILLACLHLYNCDLHISINSIQKLKLLNFLWMIIVIYILPFIFDTAQAICTAVSVWLVCDQLYLCFILRPTSNADEITYLTYKRSSPLCTLKTFLLSSQKVSWDLGVSSASIQHHKADPKRVSKLVLLLPGIEGWQ